MTTIDGVAPPGPFVPPPQPGVGFSVNRAQIDGTIGTLARQVETWGTNIEHFKQWLDALQVSDLQERFNYTEDDAVLLKSAVTEMALLNDVYHGRANVTPPRDLGVFVRRIAGVGMM